MSITNATLEHCENGAWVLRDMAGMAGSYDETQWNDVFAVRALREEAWNVLEKAKKGLRRGASRHVALPDRWE